MIRRGRFSGAGKQSVRLEGLVCVSIALATLLLNASYYMWWGGDIYGPRFLIPTIPFLALMTFFAFPYAPQAFKLLAVLSIIYNGVVVITGMNTSPVYSDPLFQMCFYRLLHKIPETQPPLTFNLFAYTFGVYDLRSVIPLAVFLIIVLGLLRLLRPGPAPGCSKT